LFSVYDVTKYIRDHPGGDDILLEIGGQDGSEEFDAAGHSDDAWDITRGLHVGILKKDENQKQQRRKPQTARLAKTNPAPIPEKEKPRGRYRTTIALSIGLGSSVACLGLLLSGKQVDITTLSTPVNIASEWLSVLNPLKRKGLGFIEGFLVSSTAFSVSLGYAIKKLGHILQYYSQYTPHKKVPRLPQRNVLNSRGWLDPTVFQKLSLAKKELIARDVYRFVFTLPSSDMMVGLPIGQHVSIRGLVDGKLVSRSYTPVSNNSDRGVLELVIRCYAEGALTNGYLSKLEVGDQVEFRGPKGGIRYQPNMAKKIVMVAGGTGITPMYQLIRAICENARDTSEVSLIYANQTEQDILLRAELDNFAHKYPGNFKVYYVLEKTPAEWQGGSGYVTKEMIEEQFAVTSLPKIFVCGPPPMEASIKKSLGALGFKLPGAMSKPGDSIVVF
jgi:cytochrome-b5 reductase